MYCRLCYVTDIFFSMKNFLPPLATFSGWLRRKTSCLRQYDSFLANHLCIGFQNDWQCYIEPNLELYLRQKYFLNTSILYLTIYNIQCQSNHQWWDIIRNIGYIIKIHISVFDSAYLIVSNSRTLGMTEITKARQCDKWCFSLFRLELERGCKISLTNLSFRESHTYLSLF